MQALDPDHFKLSNQNFLSFRIRNYWSDSYVPWLTTKSLYCISSLSITNFLSFSIF